MRARPSASKEPIHPDSGSQRFVVVVEAVNVILPGCLMSLANHRSVSVYGR